jgi:hypothetical protein
MRKITENGPRAGELSRAFWDSGRPGNVAQSFIVPVHELDFYDIHVPVDRRVELEREGGQEAGDLVGWGERGIKAEGGHQREEGVVVARVNQKRAPLGRLAGDFGGKSGDHLPEGPEAREISGYWSAILSGGDPGRDVLHLLPVVVAEGRDIREDFIFSLEDVGVVHVGPIKEVRRSW